MMKENNEPNHRKEGYILLLSLIFIGLLAMGSTLVLRLATQKAFSEKKKINHMKARIIAEAGVNKAFAMVQDDPTLLTSTVPDVGAGSGTASISVDGIDNDATGFLMTATASYNDETADAAVIIQYGGNPGTEGTDPELVQLFESVLFTGGDADMSGNSGIDLAGATAHVNGSLTLSGSAHFSNGGSVSSSTSLNLSGGVYVGANVVLPQAPDIPNWASYSTFIGGTVTVCDVPKQLIEIDLEPFRQFASSTDTSGQDYSNKNWNDLITDTYISEDEMPNNGSLTINAHQVVRPSGGVLWVEGSIKFNGSSIIEGCVVATGDIEVLGGMTHKNPNGLPAFMSVNGDVLVGSGCQVYGLVYAHNGSIKIQGAANVTGAFICPRGDFTDAGSGSVVYDNSRPSGPNGEIVMGPTEGSSGSSGAPSVVAWVK